MGKVSTPRTAAAASADTAARPPSAHPTDGSLLTRCCLPSVCLCVCLSAPPIDQSVADTSETTHISSLALLKMLKHGRAGVPMEVMGLMLGEFIDEYTVQVVDVFAMPQSGTGVSVEAVDPVFQTKMLDMLRQTNRPQMVVGWYHSHPGFGCWLSGVDINVSTAQTRGSTVRLETSIHYCLAARLIPLSFVSWCCACVAVCGGVSLACRLSSRSRL